jgi:hypothetical protein
MADSRYRVGVNLPVLVRQRLGAQGLLAPSRARPEDVVAWLGAVQAQEYGPARWALGLRVQGGVTDADVAVAFDEGRLVRTHVLRPTWHFVAPLDLRWMLALTAPRIRGSLGAYDRLLEIDMALRRRARRTFERALTARPNQTRAELAEALRADRIVASGSRLAHLVLHAELDAVVCSGPRRDKQFTYALVDERVPPTDPLSPDEALEAIVMRYFRSHGPATLRDFTWWCGLRMTDARRVLESLRASSREIDGLRYWWIESEGAVTDAPTEPVVHLLPVYDEYTVAYRDRVAVPHGEPSAMVGAPKALVFHHALVIDGQVAGTWRSTAGRGALAVDVQLRRRLSRRERNALEAAVARHGRFAGTVVTLTVTPRP